MRAARRRVKARQDNSGESAMKNMVMSETAKSFLQSAIETVAARRAFDAAALGIEPARAPQSALRLARYGVLRIDSRHALLREVFHCGRTL